MSTLKVCGKDFLFQTMQRGLNSNLPLNKAEYLTLRCLPASVVVHMPGQEFKGQVRSEFKVVRSKLGVVSGRKTSEISALEDCKELQKAR